VNYIGSSKIGTIRSKPNVKYPMIRLPQEYREIIGKKAHVYKTDHKGPCKRQDISIATKYERSFRRAAESADSGVDPAAWGISKRLRYCNPSRKRSYYQNLNVESEGPHCFESCVRAHNLLQNFNDLAKSWLRSFFCI
jgi:hypothetical protein